MPYISVTRAVVRPRASVRFVLRVGALVTILTPSVVLADGGPPAPPVIVGTPLARRIAQWDEYTGRFEAVQRVEIRPRVTGYIAQLHFTDGALVNKGDLLVTIDPRPYQLAVDLAQADVIRAKATVAQAAADYQRSEQLVKTAAASVQELDQRRANLDVARAQQMSAEATLQTAQLNLEWTRVTAPISGRISDRKVDEGNLVTDGGATGATLLTTIVSLDPIHFVFDGSEADYLRYMRLSAEGGRQSSRNANNPVQVRLADETAWSHNGKMNFVDNEINPRTGTIRGRAVFDNKDYFLTPGTFGRLRLFGGDMDALLVPDASIVSDQARKIVLTVGPDNKIVPKPVALGGTAVGLRVITSGLAPDDRVVIGGLANPFVRPGAEVSPQPGEIKPAEAQQIAASKVDVRPGAVKPDDPKQAEAAKPPSN